jgi:hypothetical protein
MLGLLLLALVLWIALGLDRSCRHRLHDPGPHSAGRHRYRAVHHQRGLRRQKATPTPLIRSWSGAVASMRSYGNPRAASGSVFGCR